MTTIIKTMSIIELDLTQAMNRNVPVQAEVEAIWKCNLHGYALQPAHGMHRGWLQNLYSSLLAGMEPHSGLGGGAWPLQKKKKISIRLWRKYKWAPQHLTVNPPLPTSQLFSHPSPTPALVLGTPNKIKSCWPTSFKFSKSK